MFDVMKCATDDLLLMKGLGGWFYALLGVGMDIGAQVFPSDRPRDGLHRKCLLVLRILLGPRIIKT